MASPMRQAASANLKKTSALDSLLDAYKTIFPPMRPPAQQGSLPKGPKRKMMEQEEGQERNTYNKPKKTKPKKPSTTVYWP